MNPSLRFGLWAGLTAVLYISLLYVTDKILLLKGWENITWLIIAIVMVIASVLTRNRGKNGFRSFRPLLQLNFSVFLIAYILKFAFIFGLFAVDTELKSMAKEREMAIVREIYENKFKDQVKSQREENIDRALNEYAKGGFGPNLSLTALTPLFGGFLLSLCVAGMVQRDEPNY